MDSLEFLIRAGPGFSSIGTNSSPVANTVILGRLRVAITARLNSANASIPAPLETRPERSTQSQERRDVSGRIGFGPTRGGIVLVEMYGGLEKSLQS